jgi:hypothetical protein
MTDPNPIEIWMLVAKAPRHEWFMPWTGGRTRKDSAAAFALQFSDYEYGKSILRQRLRAKEVRYARVRIEEIA